MYEGLYRACSRSCSWYKCGHPMLWENIWQGRVDKVRRNSTHCPNGGPILLLKQQNTYIFVIFSTFCQTFPLDQENQRKYGVYYLSFWLSNIKYGRLGHLFSTMSSCLCAWLDQGCHILSSAIPCILYRTSFSDDVKGLRTYGTYKKLECVVQNRTFSCFGTGRSPVALVKYAKRFCSY